MSATATVTVVIPTRNRRGVLTRAIASALRQTHPPHEVLVVDDASTDGTADLVAALGDERVRCIVQQVARGAPAARNVGVQHATGEFIAFLDSDDEWLTDHLARRIALLEQTGAAGAFGGFDVVRGGRRVARPLAAWRPDTPVLEYVLSGHGAARSSTLVFRRDAIARVGFDESIRKHQDWDLVARFAAGQPLACDTTVTALLHEDVSDRMSAHMDHPATWRFLERHLPSLTDRTAARVLVLFALRTLRLEGSAPEMFRYLQAAGPHLPHAAPGIRLTARMLSVPGIRGMFSRLHARYARAKSG